jgi:hypothetical protein
VPRAHLRAYQVLFLGLGRLGISIPPFARRSAQPIRSVEDKRRIPTHLSPIRYRNRLAAPQPFTMASKHKGTIRRPAALS